MNRLTVKIMFFGGTLMALCTAAGVLGFVQFSASVSAYKQVVAEDFDHELRINAVLIDFNSQVQEWKNTLLNVSDSVMREKYWNAFQSKQVSTQQATDSLLASLQPGSTRDLIQNFKTAHFSMGQGFANELDSVVAAGFALGVRNSAISNLELVPAQLLIQAAENLHNEAAGSIDLAKKRYDNAVKRSVGAFVFAAVIGLLYALWLARSVARQMGGDPAVAVEAAHRFAAGDMSSPLTVNANDSLSLMAALEDMRVKLVGLVEQVRQGSELIAGESTAMANGAVNRSARIKELADSLEDTSGSVKALSANVGDTSVNSGKADRLALKASDTASEGGKVVARVVDTMREIHKSSEEISEITAVIDGIAFQTNLLALNAAVEAARAGPEGRGFAVVASEVRSLAHRSAEAASDIKKLITESSERVDLGGKLVDKAGSTMNDVVDAIEQVTKLMSEINQSSTEQSHAVKQVDAAVDEMRKSTTESSNAIANNVSAAQRLRSSSAELQEAVRMFTVSGES